MDWAITWMASSALLSNAWAAPWIRVSAVGTPFSWSLLKKSMLDDIGTVVSAVPWMKIVGAKLFPMYVVGDAARIARVRSSSDRFGNRAAAVWALASG